MEKQPHEEYRDELAGKLKEFRNSDPKKPEVAKAKAQGYLEASKKSCSYKIAKHEHDLDKKKLNEEERQKIENTIKSFFSQNQDFFGKAEFAFSLGDEISILERENKISIEIDLPEGNDADTYIERNLVSPTTGYKMFIRKVTREIVEKMNNEDTDELKELQKYVLEVSIGYATDRIYFKEGIWKSSANTNTGAGFISSIRFKDDLKTIDDTTEKINKLRGVSFKWKSDGDSPREIGVIAEEVAEVFPELVFLDKDGKPLGVHYDKFAAVLIEAIKDLDKRLKDLEK